MDVASIDHQLVALARACATSTDTAALLDQALHVVMAAANARGAVVVHGRPGAYTAAARAGTDLDPGALTDEPTAATPDELRPMPVPTAWVGVHAVAMRRLPAGTDVLLLADHDPAASADDAVDILVGGLARLHTESRLTDLANRVDSAQQLANMGDYDWHIATDTNRWSDQLYRIYGHEPQSFNASYERFLAHIHPEDRDRISAIHQQAYASGEPYQMIERIVRPDGEVRYLSSNGQVVQDESGMPVRMRGTCIDITDTVLSEQARERTAARFRALVESAPDAILVLDRAGTIVMGNARAGALLGGEVVGHTLREILPGAERAGAAIAATGVDGRELRLDVTTAALSEADDAEAVFLHDAAPRLAHEELAASLTEARVRRQQALELNDNVMQGLSAATYSMELGDLERAREYLERTLFTARTMMNDWLTPLDGGELEPGDLVRSAAPSLGAQTPQTNGVEPEVRRIGPYRLLIADDYEDMRELLRLQLEPYDRFEIVGEAGDGEEAVRLASTLQPHVVLLDLAMPRMDGLQALPLIRDAVKDVRVIALSAFDADTMADKVLAAGAVRYVEKGMSMNLAAVLDEVLAEG